MNHDSNYPTSEKQDLTSPWPVAVVDIGATSLRMLVAEIQVDGTIRNLESFSQAVSLGKDSFINGQIDKKTIEDCVRVLKIYRAKLNEYEITDDRQIRVIATSAVKEARNRLAFQDRVFIATGFDVQPLDEAELHRVTFLGVLPIVEALPDRFPGSTLICEVSGGTTEVLVLRGDEVSFWQSNRQGSLRLRKTLEAYDAPLINSREIMTSQIMRMIHRIQENLDLLFPGQLIALGGDIRFAAKELAGDAIAEGVTHIKLEQLEALTDEILSQTADRLATLHHLSLPDADSLGPALLTYCLIARELEIRDFYVADFNVRDGLVKELAGRGRWNEPVQRQIVRSGIQLGRKFHFDESHAKHVALLACKIFEQLRHIHELDDRFLGILEMAAILHEIGLFVSNRSYHKHSLYLIRNAEFFGISVKDVELVSLVARYHRRAVPQTNHEYYSGLDREHRVAVAKLAAILRIAIALDATRKQRIPDIQCQQIGNHVRIEVDGVMDLSLEKLELKNYGTLFEDIFGLKVVLETAPRK